MSTADGNVLARKVHGPKARVTGFPEMQPLCNALAAIAATMSRNEVRSGIDVTVYGYEVVRHGDYLRRLKTPSAIYLLSFPKTGGTGLVRAHPRLLGKVLDISLGGDGTFEEANFERELTNIDVSIYQRFVSLVCRAFNEAVCEICGRSEIGHPDLTRFEEQPGMIRIAPDRSEVFVIKLNFYIADDRNGAGLDIVLPLSTLEPLKRDLNSNDALNDPVFDQWAAHMYDEVMNMKLPLAAIVDLGDFTVGEVSRFEEGQVLEVPPNAIEDVRLSVETALGSKILTHGRLGTKGRHKALRLEAEPDAKFLQPLAQLPRPGGSEF
jgi:flagellar motor switch protein FliM